MTKQCNILGSVKLLREQILQVTVWEPMSADEKNEKGMGLIRNPFSLFHALIIRQHRTVQKGEPR